MDEQKCAARDKTQRCDSRLPKGDSRNISDGRWRMEPLTPREKGQTRAKVEPSTNRTLKSNMCDLDVRCSIWTMGHLREYLPVRRETKTDHPDVTLLIRPA